MVPGQVKSFAEIYHQKTKYFREEIASNPRQLDWSRQPSPFKDYHTDHQIDLTPYLPFHKNPFTGKPLARQPEPQGDEPGIGNLSRLLYFTNGVTGILQYPNGNKLYLRAAPTAGGLYPTEIYLAVRDVSGLENGIYNFQVKNHSLVLLWEGNFWSEFSRYCYGHEAIEQSNILIILSSVFERSAWRYEDRAYRRILLDTGHILGNLSCYAAKEGLGVCPISGFFDQALNRLLFLEEEKEGVLMMGALPHLKTVRSAEIGKKAVYPSSQKSGDEALSHGLLLGLHYSAFLGREEASAEEDLLMDFNDDNKFSRNASILLEGNPLEWGENKLEQSIIERRSTRSFTGEPLFKDELGGLLRFAYEPVHASLDGPETGIPGFPGLLDPSLLETYIIVHGVIEVEPGVYYYHPERRELRQIKAGQFRQKVWEFCLGQELGRDASVVIVHATNLGQAVARYGNRAYRYLHLDAGHIGQRLNLGAVRLGLGASGIGGFFDDEVNELLDLSAEHAIVYMTTIGRPPA